MFSRLPWVRVTGIPSRSTAAQSSVRFSPSAMAFSSAARISPASKIWGVCTARRSSRSTVPVDTPSFMRLMVSVTGRAGAAAPVRAAWATVSANTSGGSRGRAPSWMAISSASGDTSWSPASTELVRSLPPATTFFTLSRPYSWHRRPTSTSRSGRVTTTISSTAGLS